jgi:alpha-1,3-rhamnosyl/mannosyltransferase
LIEDGALRERLIAAGSERARCFSWQRTADETLAVYRQIIA